MQSLTLTPHNFGNDKCWTTRCTKSGLRTVNKGEKYKSLYGQFVSVNGPNKIPDACLLAIQRVISNCSVTVVGIYGSRTRDGRAPSIQPISKPSWIPERIYSASE